MIPAEVRAELKAHAGAEAPNEACGLVLLRGGVAERYERGRNAAASPYRFELEIDPELWYLEDEGYELAVFHSHPSSPPRPSRTDVENTVNVASDDAPQHISLERDRQGRLVGATIEPEAA